MTVTWSPMPSMGSDYRYLLACALLLSGCPDSPVGSGGDTDDDDGTSTGDPTTGSPTGTPTTETTTGETTSSTTDDTIDPDTGSSGSSSGEGSSSTGGTEGSSSTGVAQGPEIEVTVNETAVETADAVTAENTTAVGETGDVFTFEVTNTGPEELELNEVAVSGVGAAHFVSDVGGLAGTLATGESTTFTVTFEPSNGGLKSARVTIANNDADEDPFEVDLRASTTPNLWRNITPKAGPSARFNMALAVASPGTLVTFGGRDIGGASLGDTWTFSVVEEVWTELAPENSPAARFAYGMDSAGDGLVVLTGGTSVPGEGGDALSDTWHFDAATENWVQSANNGMPPERLQAAVAGFDGGIFSYGGIDGTPDAVGGLFIYDAGTETWVSLDVSDPGPFLAGAAAFDGEGVVTLSGGFSFDKPSVLNQAFDFVLDDSSITAHTMPAIGPIYSHELVYLRPGFAVAFGGRDETEDPVGGTWSYEPDSGEWIDLAPGVAPSARHNFGMTAVGENKMILFGGRTGQGKASAPSFEVWEYVGPLPE